MLTNKHNKPINNNNTHSETSIAKELIKIMEKHLLEKNITAIELFVSSHNLKAINLYKNIGFIEHRKLMLKTISLRLP